MPPRFSRSAVIGRPSTTIVCAAYLPLALKATGATAPPPEHAEQIATTRAAPAHRVELVISMVTPLLLRPRRCTIQRPERAVMARVLVTGMSGAGKSSALDALGARGYHIVDTA